MARDYMISKADLMRLLGVLNRQSIGVRFAGERLRVTESRDSAVMVTDIRFRPVGRPEDGGR